MYLSHITFLFTLSLVDEIRLFPVWGLFMNKAARNILT